MEALKLQALRAVAVVLPLGTPEELAASLFPAWLFLVLALPHLFYGWVISLPASVKAVAGLFGGDPVDWFAGVSLVLNALQLGSLALVGAQSGAYSLGGVAAGLAAQPARLAALPLFALGTLFKVTIFTAIGKKGVYYGAKFGHTIPWVNGFPFSVTAHPQYLGSSLCIGSAALLLHTAAAPGHALVAVYWVCLYVLTGLAEEGLCHSCEPYAPLPATADPAVDVTSRPISAAEALRLALLAPFVLLRWACCAYVLALFAGSRLVLQLVAPADATPAVAGVLAQVTARLLLLLLGFSLDVEAPEHVRAAWVLSHAARDADETPAGELPVLVVANATSYLDALVLTAAIAPADLIQAPARGAPLAATLGTDANWALAFPEAAHGAGGCVQPFRPLPGQGPAVLLPAGVAYRAANSLNAAWTAGGALRAVGHFFQVTAAWQKRARVTLLPPRLTLLQATDAALLRAELARALSWPQLGGGEVAAPARGRKTTPSQAEPVQVEAPAGRATSPEMRSPVTRRRAAAGASPRGRAKAVSPAASPPPSTARRARARRTGLE